VAVHHRRPPAGRDPDLDGQDGPTGLVSGGEHGDLVGAEHEVFGVVTIDR